MRFLITGGNGFIGSNFILYLLKKSPKSSIINLDANLAGSNSRNLDSVKNLKNYKFIRGNIKNKKLVDELCKISDIIINFAAESHVDRSITDPQSFVTTNVLGASIILDSVRKYDKKLIQISTDEVFGSLTKNSATEDFLLNPSSPYSASKSAAELLAQSYFTTYNSDIIVTRCTNNFGPRQFPEKLIPKIILLALRNQKIPIYGTGKNVRDWIYVDDHCDAILKIAMKGKSGESYNISGNNEIDNNTIVKKILKILDKPNGLIQYVKDRPGHDFRYSLNSKKLTHELKWKPSHDFDLGLQSTVDWYVKNQKWWAHMTRNLFNKVDWKTK